MDEATLKAKYERLVELTNKRREENKAKLEALLAPYRANLPTQEILDVVQYRHDAYCGATYAILPPTKEDLELQVENLRNQLPALVTFTLGISYLNAADKDQYNKHIGRTISASKMETVLGTLRNYNLTSTGAHFAVSFEEIEFVFMLTHGKVNPFVVDVHNKNFRLSYEERVKLHNKKR